MARKAHDEAHCRICRRLARLPWLEMPPHDLVRFVEHFAHEFVRMVGEATGGRVGVVIAVYTETHHATTVSNVPDEWLAEFGRQMIRAADRRAAARARNRNELN